MNFEDFEIALLVADHQGFAAAARQMDMDPSLVSRAVARLEAQLGFKLFERSTRAVRLTEAGEIYLSRLRTVMEDLTQARDEAITRCTGASGRLRLSASVAYGQRRIVPLLAEFRVKFPNLKLDMVLSDDRLDLVQDRIDLAIRLAPMVEGDVICTKLHETRYRVVASPDYLANAADIQAPTDLTRHDVLLLSLPGYRDRWQFGDLEGNAFTIPIQGQFEFSNVLAQWQATCDGVGPALLADWMVAAELQSGRLVDLFPDHRVTATSFETGAWLIYPSRDYLPNKVRSMIDFLRSRPA